MPCTTPFAVYPEVQCTDFDLRLTYRDQTNATGNLELCFQRVWQTLDDNALNQEALALACRLLGFTEFEGSGFGPISRPLTTVQSVTQLRAPFSINCRGNETKIGQCDSNAVGLPSVTALRVTCLG